MELRIAKMLKVWRGWGGPYVDTDAGRHCCGVDEGGLLGNL